MNRVDERMEQAASDLHEAVGTVPIPPPPMQRRAHRRRRRFAPALAMAAAFVAALLIGLPALLLNQGEAPTSQGAEIAAPSQSEPSADGFPRLLVDTSQLGTWDLVHAAREDSPADDTTSYLAAYASGDNDLTSPRIWVVTHHDGSDVFRGEAYLEDGWSELPVDEGVAYSRDDNIAPLIIWDAGTGLEGTAVFIYGLHVDQESLIDVVNTLQPAENGWEATALPEGLSEIYAGPERAATNTLTLVWLDPDMTSEISLYLIDAGPTTMERNMYDMLSPGTSEGAITTTEVRGHPALRFNYAAEETETSWTAFQWMETPTTMARLVIQADNVEPNQVVASLHTVGQESWANTLESVVSRNDPRATPTTVAPDSP